MNKEVTIINNKDFESKLNNTIPYSELQDNNFDDTESSYSFHEAIEKAEGFGRYQLIFVLILIFQTSINGYFVYNLSFLTLIPVMMCPKDDGDFWLCKDADRDIDPCLNGQLKPGVYPDFGYEKSLHNWVTSMDMYCSESFETSLFGSVFFAGVLVGMTVLAFSSKYGRRINLIISSIITCCAVYLLVFVNNVYARYFGMFVLGCCFMRNIQSYIIATELSPVRLQIVVTSVILGVDVLTIPICSLYFKFVSNEWKYVTYVIIVIVSVATIAAMFVPESPLFLYEKEEYDRARAIINSMARINGSSLKNENWRFDKEVVLTKRSADINSLHKQSQANTEQTAQKVSPIKMMRSHPAILRNLVINVLIWIACSFNYFLLSFDIKNLGGDIFINACIITTAGISGKMTVIVLTRYLQSKTIIIGMFSLVLTFGFGLILFTDGWIVSLCIGLVEIGLGGGFSLCYYITSEYFPPLFLGFVFSVSQFCARGSSISSYLLSDLKAPVPMILLCTTAAFAIIGLIFLKKIKFD